MLCLCAFEILPCLLQTIFVSIKCLTTSVSLHKSIRDFTTYSVPICWVRMEMLMQMWRPEFELAGISSGSWYHCLPVRTCLWLWGRLYSSCVRSSMLHGSETWPVRKENVVALQWAEMRMVRWMCGVKLKDRLPSKERRETRYRWHSIGIAAKQAALVWACAAKRWWWLGKEMHAVWSWGSKAKRKTKEDMERGCPRGLSSS